MKRYGSKEFPVKRNSDTASKSKLEKENFGETNSLLKESKGIMDLLISHLSERASANQSVSVKTELDDFILSMYQVDRKYYSDTFDYGHVSELRYLNRDKLDSSLFKLNIEEICRLDNNSSIETYIGARVVAGGVVVVRAVIEPQWLDIALLKVNECYPQAKLDSFSKSDLDALVRVMNLYWFERRW